MVNLLLFMLSCQHENEKLAYMSFSMVHSNFHITQVIKTYLYTELPENFQPMMEHWKSESNMGSQPCHE